MYVLTRDQSSRPGTNTVPAKQTTKDAATLEREAENESLLDSTLHNFAKYYTDPKALSEALAEAYKKASDINAEFQVLSQRVSEGDAYQKKVLEQLNNLLGRVQREVSQNTGNPVERTSHSVFEANGIPNVVDCLKALNNIPGAFGYTEKLLQQTQLEVRKVRMFISILEGFRGVSALGGVKRPRNNDVKEEPDNKKPRIF